MNDNYTNKVKKLLENAEKIAKDKKFKIITTSDIFLEIIKDGNNIAVKVLQIMNANLNEIREDVENYQSNTNSERSPSSVDNIEYNSQIKYILNNSKIESELKDETETNSFHILLSILRNDQTELAKILHDKGIGYHNAMSVYFNIVKPKYQSNLDENLFKDEEFNQINQLIKNIYEIKNEKKEDDFELKSDFDFKNMKANNDNENEKGKGILRNTIIIKDKKKPTSKTPVLDNFSTDLTKQAKNNKFDPIIGRDLEIKRIIQILCKRKKNNPILIGEPGVGKTAVVEGLAQKIVEGEVPQALINKRFISLDLNSLVAGTKYRGQFEERMKSLIQEIYANPEIIVFIDEIHTLIGAGGAIGTLDTANILKPALAKGEFKVIGATTLEEYRHIEKDGALERRFQKIVINEPSKDETYLILQNLRPRYEKFHFVRYSDDILKSIIELSDMYLSYRNFPDKAIDVLDEVGVKSFLNSDKNLSQKILKNQGLIVKYKDDLNRNSNENNFESAIILRDKISLLEKELENEFKKIEKKVTLDEVKSVISVISDVPIEKISSNSQINLSNISKQIKQKIIGQDEAIDTLVRSLQRNYFGLKKVNKPIGSFIFVGQTGVGKTETARSLSRLLFQSEDALIRLDMSEYSEKFTATRLFGAPPGYVGYENGGFLTEKIKNKPYAVILLDEIEKAHPEIYNSLLQILDNGFATDSLGKKIDFRNTIILMTSNLGSKKIIENASPLGFQTESSESEKIEQQKKIYLEAIKKYFSPEFLNRLDKVITFNTIQEKDYKKILKNYCDEIVSKLALKSIILNIDNSIFTHLIEKLKKQNQGVRFMERLVTELIEDKVIDFILKQKATKKKIALNIKFLSKENEIEVQIEK